MFEDNFSSPFSRKSQDRFKKFEQVIKESNDPKYLIKENLIFLKSSLEKLAQDGFGDIHDQSLAKKEFEKVRDNIFKIAGLNERKAKELSYEISGAGLELVKIDESRNLNFGEFQIEISEYADAPFIQSKLIHGELARELKFSILESGKFFSVEISKGSNLEEIVEEANKALKSQNANVFAMLEKSRFILKHREKGSSANFIVRSLNDEFFETGKKGVVLSTKGKDISGFVNQIPFKGKGEVFKLPSNDIHLKSEKNGLGEVYGWLKITGTNGNEDPNNFDFLKILESIRILSAPELEKEIIKISDCIERINLDVEEHQMNKKQDILRNTKVAKIGLVNQKNSLKIAIELKDKIQKSSDVALLVQSSNLSELSHQLLA